VVQTTAAHPSKRASWVERYATGRRPQNDGSKFFQPRTAAHVPRLSRGVKCSHCRPKLTRSPCSARGKSAKIGRFGFQGFEKQKKLAKHASVCAPAPAPRLHCGRSSDVRPLQTYGGPAQPSIGERKPADKARKQAGAIGKKKPKSGAKAGKKERLCP